MNRSIAGAVSCCHVLPITTGGCKIKDRSLNILVVLLLVLYITLNYTGVFASWGMTRSEQAAFVILLTAATLWITEVVPLFVTSFIILALSMTYLLNVMQSENLVATKQIFMAPFFSDIILLFLGGFVLSVALHKFQVDEQAARFVMRKTGTSAPKLLAGIILITAVNSMLLSNTATTAMMLTLCLPILDTLPEKHAFRKGLVLAIPFAANVGGMGTPIGTPPNAIAISYLKEIGHPISFVSWMVMALPIVFILLVLLYFVLLFLFGRGEVPITFDPKPVKVRHSLSRFIVLAVTGITIAGWLTGKIHGLSTGTVALFPVIVLFGLRILDIKDLRMLSWDVLFIMGGGLCLGVDISSSGLAGWIMNLLPTEGMSATMLLVGFGVVACILATLMSHTATATLFLPIVVGLAFTNVSFLIVGVAFACSAAMASPIATPPNAIAFSLGIIRVKDIIKTGSIISIAALALIFTFAPWWWDILNVFD